MKIYYFGCKSKQDDVGHHLYDENLSSVNWSILPSSIFPEIDGGFCPKTRPNELQGITQFTMIDGWSIVSFWDRSVDSRLGSHSSFLVKEEISSAELLQKAKETFPSIFGRFDFKII